MSAASARRSIDAQDFARPDLRPRAGWARPPTIARPRSRRRSRRSRDRPARARPRRWRVQRFGSIGRCETLRDRRRDVVGVDEHRLRRPRRARAPSRSRSRSGRLPAVRRPTTSRPARGRRRSRSATAFDAPRAASGGRDDRAHERVGAGVRLDDARRRRPRARCSRLAGSSRSCTPSTARAALCTSATKATGQRRPAVARRPRRRTTPRARLRARPRALRTRAPPWSVRWRCSSSTQGSAREHERDLRLAHGIRPDGRLKTWTPRNGAAPVADERHASPASSAAARRGALSGSTASVTRDVVRRAGERAAVVARRPRSPGIGQHVPGATRVVFDRNDVDPVAVRRALRPPPARRGAGSSSPGSRRLIARAAPQHPRGASAPAWIVAVTTWPRIAAESIARRTASRATDASTCTASTRTLGVGDHGARRETHARDEHRLRVIGRRAARSA